jgi:uncharacterized membrane protein
MSAWVGGLIAVVIYLLRPGPDPGIVIRRFSTLALISVVILAETGLLNASLRLDGALALISSFYGALLLAKVSILIVLISFGWRMRKLISERAEKESLNRTGIALLAGREILWMGAVLGLSVALTRTAPPGEVQAGDQVVWVALLTLGLFLPFSFFYVLPRGKGTISFLQKYPDVSAIAFLIWLYLFVSFQPSIAVGQSVGGQWFAALGSGITAFLGYQLVASIALNRGWSTAGFAVVGIPVIGWWLERDVPGGLHWSFWILTLGAMLFIVLLLKPLARGGEVVEDKFVEVTT